MGMRNKLGGVEDVSAELYWRGFRVMRWNLELRRKTEAIQYRTLASTSVLEKFLSPSRHESDSVTARGHGRMERAGHGAEGLFRC